MLPVITLHLHKNKATDDIGQTRLYSCEQPRTLPSGMLPCRTNGLIPTNVDRTRLSLTVQRNIGKVAIGNE
jgi:hypothetical protein